MGREDKTLLSPEALRETLQQLAREGWVDARQLERIDGQLDQQLEDSRYILKNLGAHLTIGAVFAFDVIPLPLGTIGRVGWVALARITETLRRRPHLARVHSIGVFLIAAIPWFGYAAYLMPLRRDSHELSFLLANHIWCRQKGKSYEEFIDTARAPMRRLGRWLVPYVDCR